MSGTASPIVTIRYTFLFENGEETKIEVNLDYETLDLILPERASYPEWTELDFARCPNCPLRAAKAKHCPVAIALIDVIEAFKDRNSFENVFATVETSARTYTARTSLQKAISSLMGIYMTTSGCPVLSQMRPMVDVHLPFSTAEETTFRMLSMHLLAQYFAGRAGRDPDWDLAGLLDYFLNVHHVNAAFCDRLRAVRMRDANVNAVVVLNSLSDFTGLMLETGRLHRLERLFRVANRW